MALSGKQSSVYRALTIQVTVEKNAKLLQGSAERSASICRINPKSGDIGLIHDMTLSKHLIWSFFVVRGGMSGSAPIII